MPGHKLNPDDVDKELRQVIDERNNNQVYLNFSGFIRKYDNVCVNSFL